MATNYGLYGGYINGASKPTAPTDGRFNPYDYINQSSYKTNDRGQAQYAEDLAGLQYLAEMSQQDWQNAYNEARVADERAYQEKITADNRAYNERMIAEDREYNSYANQVKLMREAGLNPDLLGVSPGTSQTPIASGQATGTNSSAGGPNVSTNPMQGVRSPLERAGNLVSVIGSIAQTAMSVSSGALSLEGIGLSNLSSAVSSVSSLMDIGDSFSGSNVSDLFSTLPVSRSMQRKLKRFYDSQSSSPRFSKSNIDFNRSMLHSTNNYNKDLVNPMVNPLDYDGDGLQTTKDWNYVWQPLFEAEYDLLQAQLSSETKKSDYESAKYDFESSGLDVQKTMRQALFSVAKRMNSKYKETNNMFWGASLALLYNSIYGNGQLTGSVINGVGSFLSGAGSFAKNLLKFK